MEKGKQKRTEPIPYIQSPCIPSLFPSVVLLSSPSLPSSPSPSLSSSFFMYLAKTLSTSILNAQLRRRLSALPQVQLYTLSPDQHLLIHVRWILSAGSMTEVRNAPFCESERCSYFVNVSLFYFSLESKVT